MPEINISTQEHETLVRDWYFQPWKHPPRKSFFKLRAEIKNLFFSCWKVTARPGLDRWTYPSASVTIWYISYTTYRRPSMAALSSHSVASLVVAEQRIQSLKNISFKSLWYSQGSIVLKHIGSYNKNLPDNWKYTGIIGILAELQIFNSEQDFQTYSSKKSPMISLTVSPGNSNVTHCSIIFIMHLCPK